MEIPTLPKDRDHRGLGFNQRLKIGVRFCLALWMPRASKGSHLGVLQRELLSSAEKRHVLEIRARPSPFDVVNSKLIQLPGDMELVLDREGNVFTLRPVA